MFFPSHSPPITDKLLQVAEIRTSRSGTPLASASSPSSRTPTLTGFLLLSSTKMPRHLLLLALHGIRPSRFGTIFTCNFCTLSLDTKPKLTQLIWFKTPNISLQAPVMEPSWSGTLKMEVTWLHKTVNPQSTLSSSPKSCTG